MIKTLNPLLEGSKSRTRIEVNIQYETIFYHKLQELRGKTGTQWFIRGNCTVSPAGLLRKTQKM